METFKKYLPYLYTILGFTAFEIFYYITEGADSFGWTALSIIVLLELVVWTVSLAIAYYRNRQTLGAEK